VRLQKATDHALPDWLMQRHAIRAMNAALADGAHPHVYFTDSDGYLPAINARQDATPAHYATSWDVDDWQSYQPWWPDGLLAWSLEVDLVRWAVAQDFDW
jgi:hypothetical protein